MLTDAGCRFFGFLVAFAATVVVPIGGGSGAAEGHDTERLKQGDAVDPGARKAVLEKRDTGKSVPTEHSYAGARVSSGLDSEPSV